MPEGGWLVNLRESRADKLPKVAASLNASNVTSNDVHGIQIHIIYVDHRVYVNNNTVVHANIVVHNDTVIHNNDTVVQTRPPRTDSIFIAAAVFLTVGFYGVLGYM